MAVPSGTVLRGEQPPPVRHLHPVRPSRRAYLSAPVAAPTTQRSVGSARNVDSASVQRMRHVGVADRKSRLALNFVPRAVVHLRKRIGRAEQFSLNVSSRE